MTGGRWSRPMCGASLLAVMALVPPVRHALESSMTAQMLVQLPLLVAAGALFAPAVSPAFRVRLHRWNQGGVTGLVLATLVAAFWMLPRSLDASTTDPYMAAAKYLLVPLLIGLPFALSWPRMGFVVRGVFLAEVVATCFRLGWLYRVSPIRLCNNYGLSDQQRLGGYLLMLGGGLLAWIGWKLLMGRFESGPLQPAGLPPATDHPEWTPAGLSLDAASRYEDARLRGLCHEGALEAALGVTPQPPTPTASHPPPVPSRPVGARAPSAGRSGK